MAAILDNIIEKAAQIDECNLPLIYFEGSLMVEPFVSEFPTSHIVALKGESIFSAKKFLDGYMLLAKSMCVGEYPTSLTREYVDLAYHQLGLVENCDFVLFEIKKFESINLVKSGSLQKVADFLASKS